MKLGSLFRAKRPDARQHRAVALLAEADRHRDNRAWREAIAGYRAVLDLLPDPGIIVQLGNCLKENGSFEEALTLYRLASAQRPWDDDLHIQIADAEERRGNEEAAARHFKTALALNHANEAARHGFERNSQRGGQGPAAAIPAALPAVVTFVRHPPAASPFEREVQRIAASLSASA